MNYSHKITIIGIGNAGFRLALALKSTGYEIPFVVNRTFDDARMLASLLNKPEINHNSLPDTIPSSNILCAEDSDVIIISVSDDAIPDVLLSVKSLKSVISGKTTVCHISGGTSMDLLSSVPSHGVFYPLMTLSKNKPVDFSLVPFMLEYSDYTSGEKLKLMCKSLGSEFTEANSEERLRIHVAAVYVSNFVNYLASLSYDISTPNHVFLLPLALETIRKAFLYGDPAMVQTGPAARGDVMTIKKHLEVLESKDEHYKVYELLSELIQRQTNKRENVKF
ncbi:MAG: F420-dependent NADP oxidoreductase [Bacteroidales bacterium]|jgi:predicted short-subunit dehydrogenase-like oxidoreductase (DUF2520 family)|nr:F420-dependent NADP oxidoreductase [Bacteroidales bacterium]